MKFFRVRVSNLEVELFLDPHDQFDGVERICAKILNEPGARKEAMKPTERDRRNRQ